MKFRLTYALNEDEIITTVLELDVLDLRSLVETAVKYIEEEHGELALQNVLGLSVLRLD